MSHILSLVANVSGRALTPCSPTTVRERSLGDVVEHSHDEDLSQKEQVKVGCVYPFREDMQFWVEVVGWYSWFLAVWGRLCLRRILF